MGVFNCDRMDSCAVQYLLQVFTPACRFSHQQNTFAAAFKVIEQALVGNIGVDIDWQTVRATCLEPDDAAIGVALCL